MLKRERLLKIVSMVNSHGIITVNEIINEINVSDMTVRRDLDELDKAREISLNRNSMEVPKADFPIL